MTSTLIIPVENQVRELDAKLLLACVAAEHGFASVLGSKQYLYFSMPRIERGVFIAKSMRARSTLMFDIIRSLGNDIVACDEESLVRYASPGYSAWRFSASTFNFIRYLFAWGEDDAEMFNRYPGNKSTKVFVTGNPRADLLRRDVRGYFSDEVEQLRARFGDFILVNTNFSFVNPFVKKLALVQTGAYEPGVRNRDGGASTADIRTLSNAGIEARKMVSGPSNRRATASIRGSLGVAADRERRCERAYKSRWQRRAMVDGEPRTCSQRLYDRRRGRGARTAFRKLPARAIRML